MRSAVLRKRAALASAVLSKRAALAVLAEVATLAPRWTQDVSNRAVQALSFVSDGCRPCCGGSELLLTGGKDPTAHTVPSLPLRSVPSAH